MPFAPPNWLILLNSLGSNPTLSAIVSITQKRLQSVGNHVSAKSQIHDLECACCISSVTTSP